MEKEKQDLWTPKWNKYKRLKINRLTPRWKVDEQNPDWLVMEIPFTRQAVVGLEMSKAKTIRLVTINVNTKKRKVKRNGE